MHAASHSIATGTLALKGVLSTEKTGIGNA